MADYLATYLNDHLSGSEAALELLDHVSTTHGGQPAARFAAELRGEIAADRQELESLMARLDVPRSHLRTMAAWLSEKLARLKLRADDRSDGPLHLLEVWDALSVGIEGKRLLWRALAEAATRRPELTGPDYRRLEGRAEDQRRRVETTRLEAAREALGAPPAGR